MILFTFGIPYSSFVHARYLHIVANGEDRTVFRSLFRGRAEVYPARFESVKTGKAGYSPVCGNEWVRGVRVKAKIVIEIDGEQHLGDAAAYRRDRRKDVLLQTHGYLVLRFLADDLGKNLECVLDTVLRAIAGRNDEGTN